MNTKGKILAGIGAVLLLALIVWAIRTTPEAPSATEGPAQKVMKYDGNSISAEKNGRTIWKLSAESMEMDTDTQDASFTNAQVIFYAEDGRTVEMTAPHGTYEAKSRNMKIDGGVKIETSDGASLSSQELDWSDAESLLAAVGDAKVQKDDMQGTGDRIESTDGFSKIKIKGKAHIVKGSAQE